MVKSIFDLEKRTDLRKEALRLSSYLNENRFYFNQSYRTYSFWEMVNSCFEIWPFRYTAITYEDYFDLIGLPTDVNQMNQEELLYYFQFIYDFIMWMANEAEHHSPSTSFYNKDDDFIFIEKNNRNCFLTILKNITRAIELSNYQTEIIGEHYTFIKRDADVDSVLSIIENENDLRLSLLEYNDFRVEKNAQEKRVILKKLGDYLEPLRKEFNKYNKSLTDDVFFMLNKFYIRHNNEGNIKLDSDSEYIKWYDDLFKMIIQLIRTKYIVEKQAELKQFKN